MKRKRNISLTVILVSVFLIILIYALGLYSGMIYSRSISQKTNDEILGLRNTITMVEDELRYLQLQEYFINTMDNNQCNENVLNSLGLSQQLESYWSVLPKRLEEYEKNNPLTTEYIIIKKEYMYSTLKAWMIMRNVYMQCAEAPTPILYFYSKNCSKCIEQGSILDKVSNKSNAAGQKLMIFTIDYETDNAAVNMIKNFYQINSVPSLIIGNRKLSGDIIAFDDIMMYAEKIY